MGICKKIKYSQGVNKPAPKDYVGEKPLSQPEAIALYKFTLEHNFELAISYHTQGKEIYWQYQNTRQSIAIILERKWQRLVVIS